MSLSAQDQKRILDRLSERVPNFRSCPLCGTANWTLNQGVSIVHVYDPATVRGRMTASPFNMTWETGFRLNPFFPLVSITCQNCGNTHFLNLITLGLGDLTNAEEAGQ